MDDDDNGKFRLERVNHQKYFFTQTVDREQMFSFQFDIIIHVVDSSLSALFEWICYGSKAIIIFLMLYILYLNMYFMMFIILTHKVNIDLYSKRNEMSLLPDILFFL